MTVVGERGQIAYEEAGQVTHPDVFDQASRSSLDAHSTPET